ncbi:hypothetical protein D3C81_1034450 [compost metagenome]
MRVVVVQRLGVAAVAVAEQLTMAVPAQVLALFQGVGDADRATFPVVLVLRSSAQWILFPQQVAMTVVAITMDAPSTIGDLDWQRPMPQILDVLAAAQRVTGLDQATDIVIAVVPFASLWVNALDQLASDDVCVPAVAQRVDMLVDLVQRAPVIVVLAAEIVRDERFAAFQIVFKSIRFAVAAPVADHPPFVIRLRFEKRRQAVHGAVGACWNGTVFGNGKTCPLILADGAAGQLMTAEITLGCIGKTADHLASRIQNLFQLPAVGVTVSDQQLVALDAGCVATFQEYPRNLADTLWMPGVIMKLYNRLAVLVIDCLQMTVFVVQQVNEIEVAVAEPDQSRAAWIDWIAFKYPVTPFINVFDDCLAVFQLEEGQAVRDTDKSVAGTEAPQLQAITVLVDINPQLTALRVGDTDQFHLIRNTPAQPQQAASTHVPAVVTTRPLDTQQAWQVEISVFLAVLQLAACGNSDRIAHCAAFDAPEFSGDQYPRNDPGEHRNLALAITNVPNSCRGAADTHIRGHVFIGVDLGIASGLVT